MAVYRWVSPSPTSGDGGPTRCFSSHSPERGFRWRTMKCTLFVEPQLSGPNMMVYGVSALKPSCESSFEAESSLMYAPPHCSRFFSWSSYWTTRPPLPLGSNGAEKSVETACFFAGEDTTSPMSPASPSCLWVSCAHSPSKAASFDGTKAPYFERKGSKKWAPSSVFGGSYTGGSSVSVASAARATAAKPSARRRRAIGGQERKPSAGATCMARCWQRADEIRGTSNRITTKMIGMREIWQAGAPKHRQGSCRSARRLSRGMESNAGPPQQWYEGGHPL
jgi:hypothetical protein